MSDENNTDNKNNSPNNPNGESQDSEVFTLDTGTKSSADMPSVTRLLNRKSLNLSSLKPKTTAPEEPEPHAPTKRFPAPTPPPPPISNPLPKIKPVVRKQAIAKTIPLIIWNPVKMKASSDPIEKGISQFMEKGATCAIFLESTPPAAESKIPLFKGKAAVLPDQDRRLTVWTGLKWDPNKSSEIWKHLSKNGQIEFAPPGNKTELSNQRNAIRGAMGVEMDEWLLLVRIGTANDCRGIVFFLSKKSLLLEVKSVLSLLQKALK